MGTDTDSGDEDEGVERSRKVGRKDEGRVGGRMTREE